MVEIVRFMFHTNGLNCKPVFFRFRPFMKSPCAVEFSPFIDHNTHTINSPIFKRAMGHIAVYKRTKLCTSRDYLLRPFTVRQIGFKLDTYNCETTLDTPATIAHKATCNCSSETLHIGEMRHAELRDFDRWLTL